MRVCVCGALRWRKIGRAHSIFLTLYAKLGIRNVNGAQIRNLAPTTEIQRATEKRSASAAAAAAETAIVCLCACTSSHACVVHTFNVAAERASAQDRINFNIYSGESFACARRCARRRDVPYSLMKRAACVKCVPPDICTSQQRANVGWKGRGVQNIEPLEHINPVLLRGGFCITLGVGLMAEGCRKRCAI